MPTIFCFTPPPVRLHSEQHVVWCFHFIWCPPILTVVCFVALERSMIHNNRGNPCFEIDILHTRQSIIAIITVINISIILSAIVAESSPSPTYCTSSTSPISSSNSSIFCFHCPLPLPTPHPLPFTLEITPALSFGILQLAVLVVDFCFYTLGIVRDVGKVLFKLISSGPVSPSDSTNFCAAVSGG